MKTPINDLINDLRVDGDELDTLTTTDIESMTTEEAIRLGHALWDLMSASNKAIDLVKARMRGMSNGDSRTFLGGDSACHVNRTPDSILLRKGADVGELRTRLGASFGAMFREQVEPVADFMERADQLGPEEAKLALAAIDMRSRGSRVVFMDDRKSRG